MSSSIFTLENWGIRCIRFALFLYGHPVDPVKKWPLFLARICHLCLSLIFIARITHVHLFFPKHSIIKIAAYLVELQCLIFHLILLWSVKRMQKYFLTLAPLSSRRTKVLTTIDVAFLIAFTLFSAINICSACFVLFPFGSLQTGGLKFIFSSAAYLVSTSIPIPFLFFYSAMTVKYYFNQIDKLDQIKCCIKFQNLTKLLKLANEYEQVYAGFESTFSFIPFAQLICNWFQGLVYTIGAAFNDRAGQWFNEFPAVLSIYLQLCAFFMVIFAVSVNHRLANEVNCIIFQLENESVELETLQLTSRLRLMCRKPFTAWNVFELKYTFIYPYVSSLVSFSLLFLQLELRLPEADKHS